MSDNEQHYVLRDEDLLDRVTGLIRSAYFNNDFLTEVIIRPYKGKRSLEQNARMWSILQEVSKQTGHSADELHEICKKEFLGMDRIEIGSRFVERPRSTTKLNTQEFADYCDKVAMFAAQEFNVNVEWA